MGDLVIDDVEPGADLDGADMDAPDAGEETSADGGIAMASYYAVAFDTQGGEPVPELQMVEEGGYAQRPEDPTRDRSAFTGWFLDGEDYFANPTPINSDVTLTAGWEVEQLEQEVGEKPDEEPGQQFEDEIEIVDQPEGEGTEGGESEETPSDGSDGQEVPESGEDVQDMEFVGETEAVTEESADEVADTDVAKIGDTGDTHFSVSNSNVDLGDAQIESYNGNAIVNIDCSTVKLTGTKYSGIELCSDENYNATGSKTYTQTNSDVTLTGGYYGIDVDTHTKDSVNVNGTSNVNITGGKLTCVGSIYVVGDNDRSRVTMQDVDATIDLS